MSVDVLTGVVVDPLTDDEFDELDRLETQIQVGLTASFTAGAALAEINTRRLYRAGHESFADYCEKQWQMDRTRAYQLIAASEVIQELSTIVDSSPGTEIGSTPLPMNEGQARELARFAGKPEVAAAVMREASKDGPATAAKIKAVADVVAPKPKPKPKEPLTDEQERAKRAAAYQAKQEAEVFAAAQRAREAEDQDAHAVAENGKVRNALSRLLELDPAITGPYCTDPDRRIRQLDRVEQWCQTHREALNSEGGSLHLIDGGAQ